MCAMLIHLGTHIICCTIWYNRGIKMNRNVFCSRKGGATIKGKFYPHPSTSGILAGEIERKVKKMEARATRRK